MERQRNTRKNTYSQRRKYRRRKMFGCNEQKGLSKSCKGKETYINTVLTTKRYSNSLQNKKKRTKLWKLYTNSTRGNKKGNSDLFIPTRSNSLQSLQNKKGQNSENSIPTQLVCGNKKGNSDLFIPTRSNSLNSCVGTKKGTKKDKLN